MSSAERACKIAKEILSNNIQFHKGLITKNQFDDNFRSILDRHVVTPEYIPREPKNFENEI